MKRLGLLFALLLSGSLILPPASAQSPTPPANPAPAADSSTNTTAAPAADHSAAAPESEPAKPRPGAGEPAPADSTAKSADSSTAADSTVKTAPSVPDLKVGPSGALSTQQIEDLIRKVADNDMENDKRQRDYTYIERDVEDKLDGKGQTKSTEVRTYDVLEIYGEQVQRLIAKDDKPLSPKEAGKEDEKIQKIIDKRKNESDEARRKRLEQEEKDREEGRKFMGEVADAYNFQLVGSEQIGGRDNWVIDATPRPGYQPHVKYANYLPKFRFRVWIDKSELEWTKLNLEAIDTLSWGLFIARIHKGTRIEAEQLKVNDEVWLPKHVAFKLDAKLALLKTYHMDMDQTFRDYKKFRTDTKIVPLGEVRSENQ